MYLLFRTLPRAALVLVLIAHIQNDIGTETQDFRALQLQLSESPSSRAIERALRACFISNDARDQQQHEAHHAGHAVLSALAL